ncbi:hypothetical protein KRX19_08850 [Cardiobacteriaceae bacterium TAE3-ERU3]|nr:hypothetical protein [Cardiobacteriaceae bacterium TAE3-ERU3]
MFTQYDLKRKPLIAVAGIAMAVVCLPMVYGLWQVSHAGAWSALFADNQFAPALIATLISTLVSNSGALLICLLVLLAFYPGQRWQRHQRRLPFFLALPHIAFAVGLFFLWMPSGTLVRVLYAVGLDWRSVWPDMRDGNGIGLGIVLALRESWFLLWVAAAQLQQQGLHSQLLVMRSMGYGRLQAFVFVLVPQLLPRMGWALLATTAYSIAVVDIALLVGPNNPPTLAVLAWQWINHSSPVMREMGMTAMFLLVLLMIAFASSAWLLWQVLRRTLFPFSGRRISWRLGWAGRLTSILLNGSGIAVLLILLLWSLAGAWFYPALLPKTWTLANWQHADWSLLATTFNLAVCSTLIALLLLMLWLDAGMARFNRLVWLPLLLPALPLVIGQYDLLLRIGLDGTFIGVVWTHLLWVVPYMLLVLAPAYQHLDPRLQLIARSLGLYSWRLALLVRWPLLVRPVLAACAIGFSVSVAQYLPTLYSGAGRFHTVTTQAVALASGGNLRAQAVQAFVQWLLPALVFLGLLMISLWIGRKRRELD